MRRARCGAPRVPVGDRRSRPWVRPPLSGSTPRWEPSVPLGVGPCAVRSAARAGRRPAFQAVGATSAFGPYAEVGTTRSAWSRAVRGAERRACRSETGVPGRGCDLRFRAPRRGGNHPFRLEWGHARCEAPRVPVGDRRSRPWVRPPLSGPTPRWEPPVPLGVGPCAVRSTARAGRRPAFQAVGATSTFGLYAEVGTTRSAWSRAVRGAEHRACRSETGVPGRGCDLCFRALGRGGNDPSAWSRAVRGAEHRACRSETGVPGRRFRLFLNERRGLLREAAEVAVREEQEDGSFVSADKLAHPLHNGGMIVQHVRRDAR